MILKCYLSCDDSFDHVATSATTCYLVVVCNRTLNRHAKSSYSPINILSTYLKTNVIICSVSYI